MLNDNTFKALKENDLEDDLEQDMCNNEDSLNETEMDQNDENKPSEISSISAGFIKQFLCSKQSYLTPLYVQIFSAIEEHEKEGISLKEIGKKIKKFIFS